MHNWIQALNWQTVVLRNHRACRIASTTAWLTNNRATVFTPIIGTQIHPTTQTERTVAYNSDGLFNIYSQDKQRSKRDKSMNNPITRKNLP